MKCLIFFAIFFIMAGKSALATTFTYTNSETNNNSIPLGYEVPIPVNSLTPVDGFRTYDSLNLRHVQLSQASDVVSQIEIGRTLNDLPIYAYRISDDDNLTVEGALEGAVLINGGIHAREWQTPEAVTGYMEYLFDNKDDQYIGQYLLENLNFVVIPVLNIDGFLQTQRFPNLVTDSPETPRDGRMRRKNMRQVDTSLETTTDNFNGVDLNRNNAPYWATSTRSSSTTTSIVYHGSGAASEPEILALQQAAVVTGEDRLRFYIDTHSFSQLYFADYTQNSRRNRLNDKLANIMQAANDFKYQYSPATAGVGIGSTDEYFANTYQALSYTLEIEPVNSNTQYGGTGISHSGFILPNAEVPRMREETRKATMAGLYAITHPPTVSGFSVIRVSDQQEVFSGQWQLQNQQRALILGQNSPLSADTEYRLQVHFNKPMRLLENNQVVGFSNITNPLGIAMQLTGIVNGQPVVYDLNTSQGQWNIEQGIVRYKTDTFEQPLQLPSGFQWDDHSLLALSVSTKDYTGQNLDSDSATVADWQNGAWIHYEDSTGNGNSDFGGTNKSTRLIDDGSSLFTQPDPVPLPVPPSESGSGGAIGYLLMIMLLSFGFRNSWSR
ncbi:M14 family metallopeptidase [Aliiglaciecola litoralis]|uniref:Peptidase M14 domain-containing protein n=1 Tax=Aliiglaciecola litoralis TaxID=582857 RepID=A0ABN1LM99_9ALTE